MRVFLSLLKCPNGQHTKMLCLIMLYALLLWFCTEEYSLFLTFSVVQASANQNGCRPIRTRPVCLLHQWVPAEPQRALFFYTFGKGLKRTAFSPEFSSLLPFFSFETTTMPPRKRSPREARGHIHSFTGWRPRPAAPVPSSHGSPTASRLGRPFSHGPTQPLRGRLGNELGLQLLSAPFLTSEKFIPKLHFWKFPCESKYRLSVACESSSSPTNAQGAMIKDKRRLSKMVAHKD